MPISVLTSRLAAALCLAALVSGPAACARRESIYVGVPALPPLPEQPDRLGPGEHRIHLHFQGYERSYVIHVPSGYRPDEALPLVIMLHGAGAKARNTNRQTNWSAVAEERRFAVVLPEGTAAIKSLPARFLANPQSWNDGSGRGPAARSNENDVGFIHTVITDAGSRVTIDLHRIYVAGFSNGASMAFRIAAELSNKIAAAGIVAGHYRLKGYTPARSVPLVYIVGTEDPLTPLDGGEISLPWGLSMMQPPVRDTIAQWTRLLGCVREPDETHKNGEVTLFAYQTCRGGGEVHYYLVEGMGHVWPGGDPMLPEWAVGRPSDAIDGSRVIWDFFSRHQLAPGVFPSWTPPHPGADHAQTVPAEPGG